MRAVGLRQLPKTNPLLNPRPFWHLSVDGQASAGAEARLKTLNPKRFINPKPRDWGLGSGLSLSMEMPSSHLSFGAGRTARCAPCRRSRPDAKPRSAQLCRGAVEASRMRKRPKGTSFAILPGGHILADGVFNATARASAGGVRPASYLHNKMLSERRTCLGMANLHG